MIHVVIDGSALSTAQGQRVILAPWVADSVNTPGSITVGLAPVQVLSSLAVGFSSWTAYFKNTSTNGCRIALDSANTVTIAAGGLILEPGDIVWLENIDFDVWAIGSLAGGQLQRFVTRAN